MGCVCECCRSGIVVMDVIWRRLCKYDRRKGDLFVLSCAWVRRAVNAWWRCAQYFVIASCG